MITVEKVWGRELTIVNKEYCGKILVLNKRHFCSIHKHRIKEETFLVIKGKVLMWVNGRSFIMKPYDVVHIDIGDEHRFTGLEDSEIIEFSTHHNEDDSYRLSVSGRLAPDEFKEKLAEIGEPIQ